MDMNLLMLFALPMLFLGITMTEENAGLAESLIDTVAGDSNDKGQLNEAGKETGAVHEEQPVAGEPNAEIKPEGEIEAEAKPAEGQDQVGDKVVEEATASLEKALGRKLGNDEAVQELCKSHLNAEHKIQDLSDQLKELVPYVNAYERALEVIAQYEKSDKGEEGELKPEDSELRKEVELLKGERRTEKERAMTTQFSKAYDELAKDSNLNGEEFAQLRQEWLQRVKVNPYAKMPEKLARFTSLVSAATQMGTDTKQAVIDAWKAINADSLEKMWQKKLATEQQKKNGKLSIHGGKGGKAPVEFRGMTTEEMIGSIVDQSLGSG